MWLPAAPDRVVRPGLAIALDLLVGMFSTVFGVGALFDSEGDLAPIVRLLWTAVVVVRQRSGKPLPPRMDVMRPAS